jgi:hypothetical protein
MNLIAEELDILKQKCLSISKNYSYCTILDNNHQKNAYQLQSSEYIFAVGFKQILTCEYGHAFNDLQQFLDANKNEYILLLLSYVEKTVKLTTFSRNKLNTQSGVN